MPALYVGSEFERQEKAINTIYDVLDEFHYRNNRSFPIVVSAVAFLRSLILITAILASVNLLAIAYIVLRYMS